MIQPAGKKAPYIDPKPILDGWKLLEATAVYRAAGVDPFFGPGAKNPSVGQVLLMSKQQLTTRVLADPHVQIYACGRRDVEAGLIDRRVLAVIEFLSASGLDPDVSGLECGHSANGATGTDAAGATGASVDITKINGIPILGHQQPGSIADMTIRRLLTLQGSMRPNQIVSDISYKAQPNTLALPDHKNRHPDHVHAGLRDQQQAHQADREHPAAGSVDPADQPHQPDSRAGRPDLPQQVRDSGKDQVAVAPVAPT